MTDVFLYPGETNPNDVKLRDPTQTAAAGSIVDAGGIASAEAVGQPSVQAVVAAAGIASAQAMGQPAILATVAAAGIASAQALGTPAVAAAVQTSAIASAAALGAPSILATIAAAAIDTAAAFGSPAVAARITAAGIASAEAFGQPFVGTPAEIVDAGGIASAEQLGEPEVSPGAVADTEAAKRGTHVRAMSVVSAYTGPGWHAIDQAGGIESAEAFGRPTLNVIPLGRAQARRRREERDLMDLLAA